MNVECIFYSEVLPFEKFDLNFEYINDDQRFLITFSTFLTSEKGALISK